MTDNNVSQFPTASALRTALKANFGQDGGYLEMCAKWRVLRAQQQINWAMHRLETGWDKFPGADDVELDTNPLFQMKDIESTLATVTPRTALLARELLDICVTILSCGDDASVLGEGPILEMVKNVKDAIDQLPHETKLTEKDDT